jgi:hypothetical protein
MPRHPLASAVERIKMARAIEITGESERTLQAAAARGEIPGASKPCKCWTFDERELRAWIERGKPCQSDDRTEMSGRQRTRSSAAKSGGRASRLAAGSSEEAYRQAMARLRGKERASGASAR